MRTEHSMLLCQLVLPLTVVLSADAAPAPQEKQQGVVSERQAQASQPTWIEDAMAELEAELVAKYGEAQRARLRRGMEQVASFWRSEDGDRQALGSSPTTEPGDRDRLRRRR